MNWFSRQILLMRIPRELFPNLKVVCSIQKALKFFDTLPDGIKFALRSLPLMLAQITEAVVAHKFASL